jgi:predicted Rossmann-fold nucleotide-binding protein
MYKKTILILQLFLLLIIDHLYQPIIQMYDSMVENGFLSVEDRQKMLFSTDFEEIEQFIKEFAAPELRNYK